MEMRYGILQVTEALFYLHTTERLLHLNVCPQNVVVTKRGMWKLIGLSFTQNIGGMDAQSNVRTHTRASLHRRMLFTLAVWCSGNALVSINAVALRRARLVLGWVTAFGQVNCLIT